MGLFIISKQNNIFITVCWILLNVLVKKNMCIESLSTNGDSPSLLEVLVVSWIYTSAAKCRQIILNLSGMNQVVNTLLSHYTVSCNYWNLCFRQDSPIHTLILPWNFARLSAKILAESWLPMEKSQQTFQRLLVIFHGPGELAMIFTFSLTRQAWESLQEQDPELETWPGSWNRHVVLTRSCNKASMVNTSSAKTRTHHTAKLRMQSVLTN